MAAYSITCTLTTFVCVFMDCTAARAPLFSMMTLQLLGLRKARTERQAQPSAHTCRGTYAQLDDEMWILFYPQQIYTILPV